MQKKLAFFIFLWYGMGNKSGIAVIKGGIYYESKKIFFY